MAYEPVPVIGLSYGDPWNLKTWSSNPYFLFDALRRIGALQVAWGYTPSKARLRLGQVETLFRYFPRSKAELWHLTVRSSIGRQMGKQFGQFLNSRCESWGRDVRILSTSSFVNFTDIGQPVFLYGDQTFLQAYRGNEELQRVISERALREIVKFEREQCKLCTGVFCFSFWAKKSIVEDYGIPDDRVHVVGHGYCLPEVDDFDKENVEEPILLFVVTNWKKKGGYLVLKTFEILKNDFPGLKLHIVGRVPERVERHIEERDDIVSHGFLRKDRPDDLARLIDLYKKAAVLILPSVFDPMPNITLEANLAKTPVVSSDVCGIPEQVADGHTGFLVSDFEAEVYAERVGTLLANQELRYTMGRNAREMVKERFCWSAVAAKMLHVMASYN